MNALALRRYLIAFRARLAGAALTGLIGCPLAAPAQAQLAYTTLDYGTNGTFLTGIRGNNIVGDYVIPDSGGETGGLLYSLSAGTFVPFPVATSSGVNYPDAISSSPYGPSFGSQYGILRVVGSYKTASSPYNMGYLYDGAAGSAGQLTTLAYPSVPGGAPTLETIAHSTFGNQVVGNYDSQLATGNAFVYTIGTGTCATNNFPGAVSTTAYGVWGNLIAGGYSPLGPGGGPGLDRGYIYNETTGVWKSYNYPGAVVTHFEGISGGGRAGTYNLVADWSGTDGVPHAAVLHLDANGNQTWIDLSVQGALTSANSIYGDEVIGVYVVNGVTHGFIVSIPGIYNPIKNSGTLDTNTPNVPALSGVAGDDVVNNGTIRTHGVNSSGIRSDTYGVVTNNGAISVTGAGSAGVELNGAYGTLLNGGLIKAAPGADAVRTGPTAFGTVIVNDGAIDGRVVIAAGADARFENSGWLGISAPGAGITHAISGTFVQTAAGTLVLRIAGDSNDALQVAGTARLAGTLDALFQPGDLSKSYVILTAADGLTGTFDTFTPTGLPSFVTASLSYAPYLVTLNLASHIAQVVGLSPNQAAVGGALDNAFNLNGSLPGGLGAIYAQSVSQLPGILNQLSGEAHASEQSVLIDQAHYIRQAVLGRLRQISYTRRSGPEAALAYAGSAVAVDLDGTVPRDALAYAGETPRGGALNFPIKAVAPIPRATVWAQGFGGWGSIGGNANAAGVIGTFAGLVSGADVQVADSWRLGMALGYAQSNTEVGALASSALVNTGLLAGYAGTSFGAWNFRIGGTYGLNSINTSRWIGFPGFVDHGTANYNAGTGQVFSEVGYGTVWGPVGLEPFAGLAYVRLDTMGFTETGGAAALTGAASAQNVGYSSLGLRAASDFHLWNGMTLTPRGSIAWEYAFGQLTPAESLAFIGLAGANFAITGVPLAHNVAEVDAGADLRIAPLAKIGISYSGQLASRVRDNAIKGNFVWNF